MVEQNTDFLRRVLDAPPEVQAFVLEHWSETHDVPHEVTVRGLNAVLDYRSNGRQRAE